jgi:AcrR family transcriptional regulator
LPYVSRVASQAERRADTRRRLLDAAADLFAERGVEGASIDAIAERADRTSGAVYDHFGGKEGLLVALLDGWVDHVAALVGAELSTVSTLDEWLGVLWRNVSSTVVGEGRWIALEHELWSYAVRHPEARDHLARRYRAAWTPLGDALDRWAGAPPDLAPALIGLLFGLEMMRRIEPDAVTDDVAIAALRGLVAARPSTTSTSSPSERTRHAHAHL